MRAIIIDDEQPALDVLKLLLEEDGRVIVKGSYRKPREALDALAATHPDIAFLDVDMPQMNGLEAAKKIHEALENVEIVFVTAYSQYALDAFRHSALDYLLKPLTKEAVAEAVNRLYRRRSSEAAQDPETGQSHGAGSGKLKVLPFGGLELLEASGKPVRWRTHKAKEMLAYFLTKEGQPVSKWDLMADLWPDMDEEQSRSYVHTTLYQVKKALREAGAKERIEYVSGQYYADLSDLANPLREYREFGQYRPALHAGTTEAYQRVIDLYRGELFGKLDYPWSHPYRKVCFEIFRSACTRLSRHYLDQGDPDAAADAANRLLSQSEIDEEAHELMLQVHFLRKDRVALKQQYELLQQMLYSEMGIAPKPEVQLQFHTMMEKLGMEVS